MDQGRLPDLLFKMNDLPSVAPNSQTKLSEKKQVATPSHGHKMEKPPAGGQEIKRCKRCCCTIGINPGVDMLCRECEEELDGNEQILLGPAQRSKPSGVRPPPAAEERTPSRVEPARRRVTFDGVQLASVAERLGKVVRGSHTNRARRVVDMSGADSRPISHAKLCAASATDPFQERRWRAYVASRQQPGWQPGQVFYEPDPEAPQSLSGSHGEWTETDDLPDGALVLWWLSYYSTQFALVVGWVSAALFLAVMAGRGSDLLLPLRRRRRAMHPRFAVALFLLFFASAFAFVGQLNGSHGEWTMSDDVKGEGKGKGKGRSGNRSRQGQRAARAADSAGSWETISDDTPDTASTQTVRTSALVAHLALLPKPADILVRSGDDRVIAIYRNLPVFRLFGRDDAGATPDGVVRRVISIAPGQTVMGYKKQCAGHYTPIPLPDDITEVEEYTEWQERNEVLLEAPGSWVNTPRIVLAHKDERQVLPQERVYVFDCLLSVCVRAAPNTSPTREIFRALVSKLVDTFPDMPSEACVSAATAHLGTLLSQQAAGKGQLVEVANVITANTPELYAKVRDTLHTENHVRALKIMTVDGVQTDGMTKEWTVTPLGPISQPGYDWEGNPLDPANPALLPRDTERFVYVRSTGVDFWHPVVPGNPHPLQFRFRFIKEDPKLNYFSAGVTWLPRNLELNPQTLHGGARNLFDGVNSRMFVPLKHATYLEGQLLRFQWSIVDHLVAQAPECGARVTRNLCEYANNPGDFADFYRDIARSGHELRLAEEMDTRFRDPLFVPTIQHVHAFARRGAAVAWLQRCERVQWCKTQVMMWHAIAILAVVCVALVGLAVNGYVLTALAGTFVPVGFLVLYELVWGTDGNINLQVDRDGFMQQPSSDDPDGDAWKAVGVRIACDPHPKKKLYQAMWIRVQNAIRIGKWKWSGRLDRAELGVTRAEVKAKIKERQKRNKAMRVIVSCGLAVLAKLGKSRWLKKAYSGLVNLGRYMQTYFKTPMLSAWTYCMSDIPLSMQRITGALATYWFFSDDEKFTVVINQVVYHVNADRSQADSACGAAVLVGMLPEMFQRGGYSDMVPAIVANFKGEWTIFNPDQAHGAQDKMVVKPRYAAAASGDDNTTLFQHVCTTLQNGAFHALLSWRVGRLGDGEDVEEMLKEVVEQASTACGWKTVADVFTHEACADFLKRCTLVSQCGQPVYMICYGTLFRSFGRFWGTLTAVVLGLSDQEFAALSIVDRWERYLAGVVAGYCNEPGSIVMDALRERFPRGVRLTHVDADELHKQQQRDSSLNRSQYFIPTDQLVLRYNCPESAWVELADHIKNARIGNYHCFEAVEAMLRKDYGY